MGNPTIWVATKLEGKFLVSEMILRPDKLLTIVGDILISDMKEGTAQLGEFLGLAGNPERLKDILNVSPGDEVLIIPTSVGKDEETEGMIDDRANFLYRLSEAGIQLAVSLVDGMYSLTPDEVIEYLKNPDLFAARKRGVTLDHWLGWKHFVENPRCYAITKKGKPCKILPTGSFNLKGFIPGVSEYCHVHQEHV